QVRYRLAGATLFGTDPGHAAAREFAQAVYGRLNKATKMDDVLAACQADARITECAGRGFIPMGALDMVAAARRRSAWSANLSCAFSKHRVSFPRRSRGRSQTRVGSRCPSTAPCSSAAHSDGGDGAQHRQPRMRMCGLIGEPPPIAFGRP